MEYLHKLVAEGLLDPETFTQTDDQARQKLASGKSFHQHERRRPGEERLTARTSRINPRTPRLGKESSSPFRTAGPVNAAKAG
ncbi:hypothetical protein V2I01_31970 [Micromonospora sp. BRA006-A]|nr:hypothetical protein [Micromonospora sp. BRA006-A]